MSAHKIKIGILNYHNGINYGAFLRCYALYNLTADQGLDVQVINYKKLQIVSVGNCHARADINLLTIDPFQWLVLIRKAQFVVSSSFHGIVFSVKFMKQFISSPNKAGYNKISSLLHEFPDT